MGSNKSAPGLYPNPRYASTKEFVPIGLTLHTPAVKISRTQNIGILLSRCLLSRQFLSIGAFNRDLKSAYIIWAVHPMEALAISKVGQDPKTAGQWPVPKQENEALAVILNEIEKQLLILSDPSSALIATHAHPVAAKSDAALLRAPRDRGLSRERMLGVARTSPQARTLFVIVTGALLMALGWFGGSNLYRYLDRRDDLTGRAAINAVVERIIDAESNGDPNAKNSRSSATGLGQFINETWLDLIRTYRPDLARGRSESETLELRREAKLAREITTRFVERNAAMLRQRGLPVTAGTIYLAHFAGGAGAVAILSAPEKADAALVMASADATDRIKRGQIIKANPFLEHFTIADLKIWADRKMRGSGLRLTHELAADAKK